VVGDRGEVTPDKAGLVARHENGSSGAVTGFTGAIRHITSNPGKVGPQGWVIEYWTRRELFLAAVLDLLKKNVLELQAGGQRDDPDDGHCPDAALVTSGSLEVAPDLRMT